MRRRAYLGLGQLLAIIGVVLFVPGGLEYWQAWLFLTAFGVAVVFFVFRENSFTSATIEIDEGQTVVSTGPYAVARHPMYACAFVFVLATPLALGSFVGIFFTLPLFAAIVWRLLDEERFLDDELPGYREYRRRTPHRLIPFVW